MNIPEKPRPLLAALVFIWVSISSPAIGNESFDLLQTVAKSEVNNLEVEGLYKEVDLAKKYVDALNSLEPKLTASGNLEAILHLREKKEAVEKQGHITAHADKPLVELREKYLAAQKAIHMGIEAGRAKVISNFSRNIREQETALTKAGNLDEALSIRKQSELLIAELSAEPKDPKISDTAKSGTASLETAENLKTAKALHNKGVRLLLANDASSGLAGRRDKNLQYLAEPNSFRIVDGLTDPEMVSFQLNGSKNYYIRHYKFVLRCDEQPDNPPQIFKSDATFKLIFDSEGMVRIESVNYPNRFITLTETGSIMIQANPDSALSRFRLEIVD